MRHGSTGAAAALLVAGVLVLAGCDSGDADRYAAEAVQPAEVVERVSAPGAVQAAGQAELKAPAAARVERLVVKDGQEVTSGQLVAELSSEQVDDQVRQAQAAVDAASSLGGVAPSLPTGPALAAFQPARRRVQQAVDRRFNRRRYDAARTIAGFSDRLRQQVDLDALHGELLAVVDQTMQPTRAWLWLRSP